MAFFKRIFVGSLVPVLVMSVLLVSSEDTVDDVDISPSSICTNIVEDGCNITCESGDTMGINRLLEQHWAKNSFCVTAGMTLMLNNFKFKSNLFQLDWFTSNITVSHLHIAYNVSTSIGIQSEALNYAAFWNLAELRFQQIKAPTFPQRALANLTQLRNLATIDSEIDLFESGFLDGVRDNLRGLTITESITRINPSYLTNITEDTQLPLLQFVKLRLNLNNTITNNTFGGLLNVIRLNLTACNIEVIGPKAFDVISGTLKYLILNDNRMKTIPSGLFTKFIGGIYFIDISNNPWHCDCNLEEFKMNLQTNHFHGIIECETPNCIAHSPVCSTNFCNRGGESVCIDYDDNYLVTAASPNMSDRNSIIVKECYDDLTKSCEEVQIKGQTKIKSLTSAENGEVRIEIDDEYDASMLVVIWFETIKTSDGSNEYYESSEEVSCQSSNSALFRVRGLSPDTAYTICLVSKGETTISPLDCLPYYNQTIFDTHDDEIWILEEDKIPVICYIVVGAVASLLFGVAMSFVLIRKNPTWLRGNDRVVRMSNASMSSDVMVMPPEWSRQQSTSNSSKDDKPRRFSDISIISGKSYVTNPSNANEMYKRKLMEKRNSQCPADKENKYYLDYLPHKVPPPLPPPNLPPTAGLAAHQGENYYTDLAFRHN